VRGDAPLTDRLSRPPSPNESSDDEQEGERDSQHHQHIDERELDHVKSGVAVNRGHLLRLPADTFDVVRSVATDPRPVRGEAPLTDRFLEPWQRQAGPPVS
jgi:hypothetical protein